MREVGRITSGTKTISRPQSQGPMPRWRESRELMPVPPATRNNPFLPPSSLSLSLSWSKLHLAASLSRRYYVYNALHGGISQKKANRRAREAWRDRGASASSTGPGGARWGSTAKRKRFRGTTGRRDVNWNDGNSAIYFPSSFCNPVSPAHSTLRKLELFQHARHLLVRFLFPTCSHEKTLQLQNVRWMYGSLNKRVT